MPLLNPIQRVEAKREKIAENIARLQQDLHDLDTTIKVLRSIEGEGAEVESDHNDGDAKGAADASKLGPPRPSGCPTNFDMVDMILSSAEKDGKDGLTVAEIIAEIRRRYWPGLNDAQVSAPIYAFARKGRFKKTASGKFKRIKKVKEGSDLLGEEASHAQ